MKYPTRSPSGLPVIPPAGPLNAPIMLIGESPASEEMKQGLPFVGPSGRLLNQFLAKAGIDRGQLRIVNAVPCRAPADHFDQHRKEDLTWGRSLLEEEVHRATANGCRVLVPLGDNPLAWISPSLPQPPSWSDDEGESKSTRSRVGVWRGSLVPYDEDFNTIGAYERWLATEASTFAGRTAVLPTYHPAAVLRQFSWHPSTIMDLRKAREAASGAWKWPRERRWFLNRYEELDRFVDLCIAERLVSIDTEMNPPIVGLCNESEVHVFVWDERARDALQRLLSRTDVIKVAHNAGHDFTFLRVILGLDPRPPLVDTGGLAHILDSSLPRNLSPALSTRFTTYPYHKWMVDQDRLRYCGYDTLVAYEGYWKAIKQVADEKMLQVATHDHMLLWHLLEMQWTGIRVDEVARQTAVTALSAEYASAVSTFVADAKPVVRARLGSFEKKHLFFVRKQCECCNGGKLSKEHCWRCGGLAAKPTKKADYGFAAKGETVTVLRNRFPSCATCSSTGKTDCWLPIDIESPQAVADILYRGLRIRPRRYKGSETVRADAIEPLAEKYPLVAKYIAASKIEAGLSTMKRMEPDWDGKLHSTFDPWGTVSGRVASSEGLLQRGTNNQNFPKKYRYVLTADSGCLLVAPDMAQIEGRCIAVISDDAALRAAYTTPINWPGHKRHGTIDSHTALCQALVPYGILISRDQSKRASYAGWYGASADQLALELSMEYRRKGEGCEVDAGQAATILELIKNKLYPGIGRWQSATANSLLLRRELVSPTGRRRRWYGYITESGGKGKPSTLVEKVWKEGLSFFPQDMACWVVSLGLDRLKKEAPGLCTPLVQVHDEIVIQIQSQHRDEALQAIGTCMTVEQWGMQFPADVGEAAPNWSCAKGEHADDAGSGKCPLCGSSTD